ncbi:hypothetical protein [Streptomyces sp. NPDC001970]
MYISPAQTYQEVRELSKAFGRMESKLDAVLNDNRDIREDVQDHATRIRALESKVWAAAGGATVLGAGAGILAQVLLR